jgi:hypothetical protein
MIAFNADDFLDNISHWKYGGVKATFNIISEIVVVGLFSEETEGTRRDISHLLNYRYLTKSCVEYTLLWMESNSQS